jgi:hypothetical protein
VVGERGAARWREIAVQRRPEWRKKDHSGGKLKSFTTGPKNLGQKHIQMLCEIIL